MSPPSTSPDESSSSVLQAGYVPGVIGSITRLHARYYAEHWNFHLAFEATVATELADFFRDFTEGRDGFWTARLNEEIAGSIAIDGRHGSTEGARLRWFIVDPDVQGRGWGTTLMDRALAHCREVGFDRVFLWTFEGLDAARRLYERYEFQLCKQHEGEQWGPVVIEQMFERDL